MRARYLAPAVALPLILAGCSGDPEPAPTVTVTATVTATVTVTPTPKPSPSPSATAAAPSGIPSPSATEAAALVAKLAEVRPAFAVDPEKTVDRARNQCSSILGGGADLAGSAQQRFTFPDESANLSLEEAQRVSDIIAAEPWCR